MKSASHSGSQTTVSTASAVGSGAAGSGLSRTGADAADAEGAGAGWAKATAGGGSAEAGGAVVKASVVGRGVALGVAGLASGCRKNIQLARAAAGMSKPSDHEIQRAARGFGGDEGKALGGDEA